MIRLPLRRLCEKHGCRIIDVGDADKERLICERGHRCEEWLIVDADDMCVGVGHKDDPGQIFTEPTPLPNPRVSRLKRCKHGHMDWVRYGASGKLRCFTCYSASQRRYRERKRREREDGKRRNRR